MSFILDALRKSEHDRQRQTGPGIADLRAASTRSGLPIWAIALGGLLLINLIVALVLILRSGSATGPQAVSAAPAQQMAATRIVEPPTVTPALPPGPGAQSTPAPMRYEPGAPLTDAEYPDVDAADSGLNEPQLAPKPQHQKAGISEPDEGLPTVFDPALQNSGAIPDLHLDIHVYADRPADRFVFINNRKYREGGETPEGTMIERITPDGVILNHRGLRFVLPRQ